MWFLSANQIISRLMQNLRAFPCQRDAGSLSLSTRRCVRAMQQFQSGNRSMATMPQMLAEMSEIITAADMDDRDLTPDELTKIDRLEKQIRGRQRIDTAANIAAQPKAPAWNGEGGMIVGDCMGAGPAGNAPDRPTKGRHGVIALNRDDKFADVFGSPNDTRAAFGEFVRAVHQGADQHTPLSVREVLNTQTTTPDSAGGALVPSPLSSVMIDKARALMVTNRAGMTMFSMDSESLAVPTVETDPTFAAVAEAGLIGKSDVVFGSALLTPKKVAGIVEASNELVSSGLDFAARLQMVMSSAIAVAVDDQLLNGDGTGANVLGLFNQTGIAKTTLTGVLTRAAIDAAVLEVSNRNHQATAVILSPANWHALANEADTEGRYLGAPDSSAGLTYLASTTVADTECAVGDFSTYGIGQREGLRLEISRVGDGTAWSNDLSSFRAIVRVDGTPMDASGIQIIDGITLS